MSESESNVSFGKWLAGVLATVVSGVAIYQLTEGHKNQTPQSPPPEVAPGGTQVQRPVAPQMNSLLPQPAVQEPATPQNRVADLSGSWQGELSQLLPNGASAPYTYTVELSQEGNAVSGTAHIQMPPPYNYWVTMRINGVVRGASLRFEDGEMTANNSPPGWFWCRKAVALTYDESEGSLIGTWAQNGCGSGQVNLSR